ncbi:hypothetical protein NC651_024401 [Populus alba x Populus x berolinensis]|nr:hypothetical protein NC651_024401 [Populus alba x Populus x berolinensis]
MDIYSFFLKIRGLVWSEPSKRQQMVAFHKYAPFSTRITFYPVVNFQVFLSFSKLISHLLNCLIFVRTALIL